MSEENARGLGSRDEREVYFGTALVFFVATSVAIVATFSEFARHLSMASHGFSAPDNRVITWARFSLQEWVDAVSLGSASIFGRVSAVEPIAWWSKTLVVFPYHLLCNY
jgi:hypothetical protein